MPTRATLMNPSVALNADKPRENSVPTRRIVGMVTAIKGEKCIPRSVPLAAKIPRYLSSLGKDDPYTAASVIPKLEARLLFRQANKKRMVCHRQYYSSPFPKW